MTNSDEVVQEEELSTNNVDNEETVKNEEIDAREYRPRKSFSKL